MQLWRTAIAATVLALSMGAAAQAALHPGDTLRISVYNHPELATQAVVNAEGLVSIPLAGEVPAVGVTEKELASRIQDRLASYVRYPAVDVVLISQSLDMSVVGGPGGMLQYRPGETLLNAMGEIEKECTCSLSVSRGDTTRVKVVRDGFALGPYDIETLKSTGDAGPSLQPGDRITFVDRPIGVSVKGAVKAPGMAYLSAGQPLSAAIDQLGGLTDSASYGQILLKRNGTEIDIGQSSPEFSAPAQPGDSLVIPSEEHVQVIGAVNGGGEVVLKQDFTLASAVYAAGGPNKWADLKSVMVKHNGVTRSYNLANLEHGNPVSNPAIEDGDVVFVPEGHKIDFKSFFQNAVWARWLLPGGRL